MAVVWKVDAGHQLSSSAATLLTFSASAITGGAKVMGVTLVNRGSSDRVVEVFLVANGGSATGTNSIFRDTVPANSTLSIPGGPWPASASAFVQASQDSGTDVSARVHAFEET